MFTVFAVCFFWYMRLRAKAKNGFTVILEVFVLYRKLHVVKSKMELLPAKTSPTKQDGFTVILEVFVLYRKLHVVKSKMELLPATKQNITNNDLKLGSYSP